MAKTFDRTSTADDVLEGVDLRGKHILVTGVSAGLGVETARSLVAHGAQIVGAARDLSKARSATRPIQGEARHGGGLRLVELDLASLASVRAGADALVAEGEPFDVIIANAGIMACPMSLTEDGFENQFGTNYVGHFLLINRLASLLEPGSRVVVLSSQAHRVADVDLTDPNFEHTPYNEQVAYGRSKTACSLFAVEFDRRHRERGVRATSVHPGQVQTELGRYMTPEIMEKLLARVTAANRASGKPALELKTIPQGAATSVWSGLVAPADLVGGRFCEDCQVAPISEDPAGYQGVLAYALDPSTAKSLWAMSEKMVGEQF